MTWLCECVDHPSYGPLDSNTDLEIYVDEQNLSYYGSLWALMEREQFFFWESGMDVGFHFRFGTRTQVLPLS